MNVVADESAVIVTGTDAIDILTKRAKALIVGIVDIYIAWDSTVPFLY